MNKRLNPEYHLDPGAVQAVQRPVLHQDRRPGWTILVPVFAALLGAMGGGILVRDVQRNVGILAVLSQDVEKLRASIARSPVVARRESERPEPVRTAQAKEAAGELPATPTVESEQGNPSAGFVSSLRNTPAAESPVDQGGTNSASASVSALSLFQRMHNGQGRRRTQTGGMVPYLRNLLASAGSADGTANSTSADNGRSRLDMLSNGVQYRANKSGYGKPPKLTDMVVVHYLEVTPEGAVVEETYSSGKPVTLDMKSLDAGLRTALLKMPEGAEWEIYVPGGAAPADATETRDSSTRGQHVYLVELLEVIRERGSRR